MRDAIEEQRAPVRYIYPAKPGRFLAHSFDGTPLRASNDENRGRSTQYFRSVRFRGSGQIGTHDGVVFARVIEQWTEMAGVDFAGVQHLCAAAVPFRDERSPGTAVQAARSFICAPHRMVSAIKIGQQNGDPRVLRQGTAQLLCDRACPGSAVCRHEGKYRAGSGPARLGFSSLCSHSCLLVHPTCHG